MRDLTDVRRARVEAGTAAAKFQRLRFEGFFLVGDVRGGLLSEGQDELGEPRRCGGFGFGFGFGRVRDLLSVCLPLPLPLLLL
jgi:hypothetical protein